MNPYTLKLKILTDRSFSLMRRLARTVLLAAVALGMTLNGHSGESETVSIYLADDVSGEELTRDHGIHPADFESLTILADILFRAKLHGYLFYDVVDEDAGDNIPMGVFVKPFSSAPPNKIEIPRGIPVREKQALLAQFENSVREYSVEHGQWKSKVLDAASDWIDDSVEMRTAKHARFLKKTEELGRDFRHSDVIGTIKKANTHLGKGGLKFLILNTDLVHKPGAAAEEQKSRPLVVTDLSPDVILILVNTSRVPDTSKLLDSIKNIAYRAESLKDAATLISEIVAEQMPKSTNVAKSEITPD